MWECVRKTWKEPQVNIYLAQGTMEEVARTSVEQAHSFVAEANGGSSKAAHFVAAAGAAGSHIISAVQAASRRPETEESAEKDKGGSDGGFPEHVEDASGSRQAQGAGFSSFVEEVK